MAATLQLFTSSVSDRTRWHVLRLTSGDGQVGLGECSDSGPLPGLLETLAVLAAALGPVAGSAPDGPEAVHRWADQALASLPDTRWARTALGGVEQTLCDAGARASRQPLWQWLGGQTARPVPTYANINRVPGGRAPADVARAAVDAVKDGFPAVKCAPFDVADERLPLARIGLARLAAVREAVGPGIGLMVDCHLRLTPAQVQQILPELHRLDVSWLEDAVDIEDVAGLARLRDLTAMTLAGGEFAHDPAQLLPAVRAGVIDVVMPDVKHAGGITRALALARAVPDIQVAPHNPSGPVGTAAGAHLFLAAPNATVLELATGEADWRPTSVRPPEHLTDGCLVLPAGPGLGIDLDVRHPSTQLAWSVQL